MKKIWEKYNSEKIENAFSFNDGYKNFISIAKTERECVWESIRLAELKGFKNLEDYIENNIPLKTNDKVYIVNRNKNICLFVIGKEPITSGINILGAHIDSPRVDLKQNPLYESDNLALLKTHYYGGVKKYQWVAMPLAIHGVVCKKDGSVININIGEDENDPVFGFSDLLPHLAADQMSKVASKVIEGEDLNLLIGSLPETTVEKEKIKSNILNLLKTKYNIEEDDFISSELEIVPSGKARDYGLDKSMVMGYGHDDRVCAYTSLMAILNANNLEKTACCILVDKEEVGSNGSTGMHSDWFKNTVGELLNLTVGYSELTLSRVFKNCKVLSSDVSAAYDPNFSSVYEAKNSAYLNGGIVFNKYTGARGKSGCNDANPEYIAQLRKILDDANIVYQTAELGKVDQGGGGTIAYILANMNMEVIDAGIAVLNMHAPWEIVSKIDVFEAYNAYVEFLKNCK